MNNYLISDLDEEYVGYLYEHIPILAYSINNIPLLQQVLKYCSKKIEYKFKAIENIKSYLYQFTEKMNNNKKMLYSNISNTNRSYIINNKNKKIKVRTIDKHGLIEGIIFCTLDYINKYKYNNNNKFVPNINVLLNNKKLYLKMSEASGSTLDNFIIDLYQTDKNEIDKNKFLFDILKEIVKKLYYLQQKYEFIHGDFHSGNIFVKYDENEKIIINFIDFEFSTIKLISNKNIILKSNVNNNKYNIPLEAFDLFTLIEELKTFKKPERITSQNFEQFNKFLGKLSNIYKINKNPKRKSNYFEDVSYLYPKKFLTIEFNEFPKIENINRNISYMNIEDEKSNEEREIKALKYNFNNSNKYPSTP